MEVRGLAALWDTFCRRGARMVVQVNPYGILRRVIIAAVTGTLPEESRTEALQILTEAIKAPDEDLRGLAIIGLGEIGGPVENVLPSLARALRDFSPTVRRRAARVLGDLAPASLPAVPHLTAALSDPEHPVRLEAVNTLGRIGTAAETALPGLIPMLANDDVRTGCVVSQAIRRIGGTAVPFLLALLLDSDAGLRHRAVALLGDIGTLNLDWGDEVISSLLESCSDADPDVRQIAREALDKLSGI
jgi:HEAT repeat protein